MLKAASFLSGRQYCTAQQDTNKVTATKVLRKKQLGKLLGKALYNKHGSTVGRYYTWYLQVGRLGSAMRMRRSARERRTRCAALLYEDYALAGLSRLDAQRGEKLRRIVVSWGVARALR